MAGSGELAEGSGVGFSVCLRVDGYDARALADVPYAYVEAVGNCGEERRGEGGGEGRGEGLIRAFEGGMI